MSTPISHCMACESFGNGITETLHIAHCKLQIADFCREIEAYLCRKNDGHLIRVTGPSFDLVAGWAAQGVPLRVAFQGIDRYFERYYRKGLRRRPVRIDFCDADVLDVFDQWRRAVGLTSVASHQSPSEGRRSAVASRESLPAHLERIVLRLTAARAAGAIAASFDSLIDRVAGELDAARAEARGVRGDARQALIDRLATLDRELLDTARFTIDGETRAVLAREAEEELARFRASMTSEAFARAREAAADRLLRERFGLPTLTFP